MVRRHQVLGLTLFELFAIVIVIAVLGSLVLSLTSSGLEPFAKSLCKSNMKQIGLAISMYANDNDEFYPTYGLGLTVGSDDLRGLGALSLICNAYARSPKIFKCPGTEDDPNGLPLGLSVDKTVGLITLTPAACSYAYDSQKGRGTDPATPIAADKPDPTDRLRNSSNHGNAGQVVLYYDGHVEWAARPTAGWTPSLEGREPSSNDHIYTHWDYGDGPAVLACSDTYVTQ